MAKLEQQVKELQDKLGIYVKHKTHLDVLNSFWELDKENQNLKAVIDEIKAEVFATGSPRKEILKEILSKWENQT